LYGLGYGHWQVALVRNIYVPLLGLLSSCLLVLAFDRYQLRDLGKDFYKILLASFSMACVMALVVNPITYGMLGQDLAELTLGHYTQDLLYFCLFYVLWCVLYLLYVMEDSAAEEEPGQFIREIVVEQNKEVYNLNTDDLMFIRASGDYIELVTDEHCYLKNATLTSWEKSLDPDRFLRVSRALIVNLDKVVSVKPLNRGTFQILMRNDQKVQSSRGYRAALLARLPKA
jgi:DNA-binding LytR/AlgR family response regulator